MRRDRDPFRLEWPQGSATAGYRGEGRWRCTDANGREVEVTSAELAAGVVVQSAFEGVEVRGDVARRADLRIVVGDVETLRGTRSHSSPLRWWLESERIGFDVGDRAMLERWVATTLAARARRLIAAGVTPEPLAAIDARFAFDAFERDVDPGPRCAELAAVLGRRIVSDGWPPTILHDAAMELRALGHDLWSWDFERSWGHDYMTARPGAGLALTLVGWDDEPACETSITVEFAPPSGAPGREH